MADPEIRSTPEKYPTVGALSRLVGRVDKFARAPFGYSNPPVEMLSDLLEIPALYRTGENIAYGSPLTIGAGQARRMTEDTTGAVGGALNLIGPAASTAKLAVKGAKAAAPRAGALAQQLAVRTQPMPLQMNIVKPKGGNWLAGDIERVTKPMKTRTIAGQTPEERIVEHEKLLADPSLNADQLDRVNYQLGITKGEAALDKWIDKKLNSYIKNEMGTPEDPVRALAEEGVLHFQPRGMTADSKFMEIVEENRARGGFPFEDTAATPLGKLWERYADYAINPRTAGEQLNAEYPNNAETMPWLSKIPPETNVYNLSAYNDFAGFPHLVDELKAAINPASEVPEHLRFTADQLDKVTVPQAVKRVAEINAWRAKQAAEAEKQGLMANLQATPRLKDESMQLSFVEKPGATWVDVPETVTKDGLKLCTSLGKAGGWCTQSEMNAKSYGSGSNRLTTLIDAEGRPHAQAKITRDKDQLAAVDFYGEQEEALEWLQSNMPKAYDRYIASVSSPPNITELKPPGNSFTSERSTEYLRRDPDYKAKVTDSVLKFLNSGTWGKVNDLQHYDIVRINPDSDLGSNLRNAGVSYPQFVTQQQLTDLLDKYGRTTLPPSPEGFAKGGLVEYDPDHIESLAQGFDAEEFASGGAVNYNQSHIDELAAQFHKEM